MNHALLHSGILLPESVLNSGWFAALAAFVAVNTVVYVCLALLKIAPRPRFTWRGARSGRSRRSETRSIHPDARP